MNLVMLIKYGCATLILKSWFINEEFGKSQTRLLSVITHLNAWLCFCHFSFKDKWQSQIFCYFGTKAKNFTRAHWKNVKSTYDSSANDEAVDQISKYLSTINWLYLDIKQIKKNILRQIFLFINVLHIAFSSQLIHMLLVMMIGAKITWSFGYKTAFETH